MPTLHELETWMLSVVTNPRGVATPHAGQVDHDSTVLIRLINETDQWPAGQRMHVYWNAYFVRLIECLRNEFPTLLSVLGDDAFDDFARGYLEAHPPRSYTLGVLGAHFAAYLAETRPARIDDRLDWADCLVDLAAYEWTLSEVFDGPGGEDVAAFDAAEFSMVPEQRRLECTFAFVPGLALRRFRFPVHAIHDSIRRGESPTIPPPSQTCLALSRRNYVVQQHSLGDDEFQLLELLASGCCLGDALETLLNDGTLDAADIARRLAGWFERWTRFGLLVRINLPK
jgi:hypothetical protein